MPLVLASLFCLLLIPQSGSAGRSDEPAQLPRAELVVKAHAYVSLEPVPRGSVFEAAVVAEVLPGFHINANKVLQNYLIPTRLEAELPAGFRLVETIYPPGQLRRFGFSPEKMAVYDGSVTLRMKLEAQREAPLGPAKLPLALSYQACNETTCFPPVKISVPVQLEIAPTGAKARATHPSIFRHRRATRDRAL